MDKRRAAFAVIVILIVGFWFAPPPRAWAGPVTGQPDLRVSRTLEGLSLEITAPGESCPGLCLGPDGAQAVNPASEDDRPAAGQEQKPAQDERSEDKQTKRDQALKYDVVVTATRIETPSREVASSITVITAQELARTRKSTVLEALRDVAGLSTLQNGGPGAAASVSIRGANNEHTLVLIDGVELNDPINPSRSCDLAHLPLNLVERIEILRGPQSPLYGSDALGGVINVITRTGRGRPRLTLAASGGSFGTVNGDLGISGSAGKADYAFGAAAMATRGISAASRAYAGNSEPDGFRSLAVSGKVGAALRRNLSLDVSARSTWDRTEIDGFGGPYGDDPNSVQDYAATVVRVQARGLFAANRWEQKLAVSWVGASRKNRNPVDAAHPADSERADYESGLVKIDWQNNLFLGAENTLTAGVEAARERGRSDYVSESAYGPYVSSFPSETAGSAGFYIQDQWKAGRGFFVTAGGRLDSHSRSGTALTYRIAPAFMIERTGTRFKATLGTGFKSPSLYQLFAPGTAWGPIGNPGLRPERATGWDAGIEQEIGGSAVRAGVTYFATAFRDLIDFDYAAGYVNVGRARTRGVEVSLEARPGGAVWLRTAYTRLSAKDLGTGAALLRRPRDKFTAEAQGRLFGRIDAAASLIYMGGRTDHDFSVYPNADVILHGYALLNVVLSTPLAGDATVFLRLDNLTNTRYEMVWGYGTPGFALTAGFSLGVGPD